MRDITHIVVHCSATKASMNIGVDTIRQWHLDKGWSDVGYHYVIKRDGTIETGRELGVPGAHVEGHNKNTIGICLVGGLDKFSKAEDNFTRAQYYSLKDLVSDLLVAYPTADVLGHRDFPGVKKDCPCFDVRTWWKIQDV